MEKKRIYLIDGYNFIYRLFYAVPPFSTRDGTPINAVFGLAKILIGILKEDRPDYLIFIMDSKGKKYREDIYPEYKGTREKMPSDLKVQEPLIFDLLDSFSIPTLSSEGFEADDIIGTLATKLSETESNDISILSGDKDLYQFIRSNVCIYDTMKKKVFHRDDAIEKFGVEPEHVVDYLSICGDSSDNIPGIPGFGPKKAQELISKFGSLENIYANIESISGKTKDTLIEKKELAFLSKKLATITIDVNLPGFDLEKHIYSEDRILTGKAILKLKEFEFKSLVPNEHREPDKNFGTLKLEVVKISSEYQDLLEKMKQKGKISISTYGDSEFKLGGISINLGDNKIYWMDVNSGDTKNFIEKILSLDIEIIGFDQKIDKKRFLSTLEGVGLSHFIDKNPLQASLF